MVKVGQRVEVKQSGDFAPVWYGRTGLVTEDRRPDGFTVNIDPVTFDDPSDCEVKFYTDELIVLGGKHAGQPHPENFTDIPPNYNWALFEAGDRGHGKHAAQGDKEAEMAAYESEQHYL